jgi:AraC-like DNA-binding protein
MADRELFVIRHPKMHKHAHDLHTGDPSEKTRFWRDPGLQNLELLQATYVTHAFAPHTHEGFAIGVIEHGAETFTYRHASHVAPAGSIVVINPDEPHTGQALTDSGWTYRMLYPESALLQQAASALADRARDVPFFPSPVIRDEGLAALILDLHISLETPSSSLERESRFLQTFAQLIARHADDRPPSPSLDPVRQSVIRARDYLESHFNQDVTLDQLTRVAGLSPFHLLRTFRRALGMTPHAYVTQLRVTHARRLLQTGLPISQVALETGFNDQSHLTRRFKQIVGVTPGQYRLHSKNRQDSRGGLP